MAGNFNNDAHTGTTAGFRFVGPAGPHPVYDLHKFAHITGNRFHNTDEAKEEVSRALTAVVQLERQQLTMRVKGFLLFESKRPDGSTAYNHVVDIEGEPELMSALAKTDPYAMPERNGVLYQYVPVDGVSVAKTFHISLGPDVDGARRACFRVGDTLSINSAFFKVEGPHDPFFVVDVE
jgi:hypothetical protein